MSKKIFLIMIFLISSLYLFAETIFVAPMIIYDKDSNIIEQTKNPSEEIFERISMYWFEWKNIDNIRCKSLLCGRECRLYSFRICPEK